MPEIVEPSTSMSLPLAKAIETSADSLARQMAPGCDNKERERWESLVDRTLIEWGRDPAILEDDGIIPPTIGTVKNACDIARVLCRLGLPAPTRIVPTGDGGIAFQADADHDFVSIEIAADGTVEYLRFSGSKLVERYEVVIPRAVK